MAYYFPEGSKFYFSKTFAAAKAISAITNAAPAVATAAAHLPFRLAEDRQPALGSEKKQKKGPPKRPLHPASRAAQ